MIPSPATWRHFLRRYANLLCANASKPPHARHQHGNTQARTRVQHFKLPCMAIASRQHPRHKCMLSASREEVACMHTTSLFVGSAALRSRIPAHHGLRAKRQAKSGQNAISDLIILCTTCTCPRQQIMISLRSSCPVSKFSLGRQETTGWSGRLPLPMRQHR